MIGTLLRAPVEARTWREFGYVLVGLLFAVPVFPVAAAGLVGAVYSVLTIGLPVLVGALVAVRYAVVWFRLPARWFLAMDWPAPPPRPRTSDPVRFVEAVLRDGTAWRALAYGFAKLPLMLTAAYLTGTGIAVGVVSITYPAWWFAEPMGRPWSATPLFSAVGVGVLLVLPWWVRFLVAIDRALIRALLVPSRDRLRLTALRADSAAVLRRVERDLHDGTQARLVTLGVTLSRIEARADDAVRPLVEDAQNAVVEALAELRDIVRGLHPPALDDGLPIAVETLAGRAAVPVDVHVDLPAPPPDVVASAVYFTAGELLTNVSRHAGATRAGVDLRTADGSVRLTVTDDGRGGARVDPRGTGLAGLRRRALALDGTLTIDSPPGGPTTVTLTLPQEAG